MLIVTVVPPVNAQQGAIRRGGSLTWTGGNKMSPTTQPLPATANTAVEANDYDVRYNVVPIGVLPGKTVSFLTVVRAVNNLEHVTGYSYVYSGNLFLTGQGFIWENGKLKALPLLSG